MEEKKSILVINGSASENSSNQKLTDYICKLGSDFFEFTLFNDLKSLPHFDPELSAGNPPKSILDVRELISKADGIIICTPEYVFSIPSGLKNLIEWCVSTTIFSDKPVGIITASAHGQKGHDELLLIMNTVMAKLSTETSLLIQGIKGKIDNKGNITDNRTAANLNNFITAFKKLIESN